MAVDPQKAADTQAWLIKAQRDLIAAKQLLAHTEPLLDVVAYHCQQAGEKALKGYLFWYDMAFRKTHNLQELLAQCSAFDATLDMYQEHALFLTPLATEFRYPGDVLQPSLEDTKYALERAKSLLEAIMKRLPAEVAPTGRASSAISEGI